MIISRKTVSSANGDEKDIKGNRSVVTKTVERTGGVRTTTTTFKACTRDGIDTALAKLDIDPEKFHSGGTTVTKTIVYTDSSGKREVLEETVENYGDPDKIARSKEYRDFTTLSGDAGDFFKSKTDAQKMGSCVGKKRSGGLEVNPPGSKSDTKLGSGPVESGNFIEDCLKAHNHYRDLHGVPPLVLSKELCAYSQEWADHLAATDAFKHRTQDKKYGENIFMKWSSDPDHMITGNEPVDSWYSEIKDHVFGREPTSLKSGHFTQVIWKESRTLGVAWAKSKSGKILVVANYDPAGNFIGRFAENVPAI